MCSPATVPQKQKGWMWHGVTATGLQENLPLWQNRVDCSGENPTTVANISCWAQLGMVSLSGTGIVGPKVQETRLVA